MRFHEVIIEKKREEIGNWNPLQISPALLTQNEYWELANPSGKIHRDSAYDDEIESLNLYHKLADTKYHLINQVKIHGITFRIMVAKEKRSYPVRNPDPDANGGYEPWVKVDGKIIYYTDEQIVELGLQPYEYIVSVFDGDTRVAAAQDEWGCMLIRVAREYRRFGLGTIVGKLARTLEPSKNSGGFTPSGSRNFRRVHAEFVRDALKSGLYRSMITSGQITKDRVKEIIASVGTGTPKQHLNLGHTDPLNWLLYANLHGTFILYDRNIYKAIEANVDDIHIERMIKGYVYAMVNPSAGNTKIKQFGGDDTKIKAMMLALAYTHAKMHDSPLWVEPEEYNLPGFKYGDEDKTVGYSSREILDGKMIDYRAMVDAEARYRKSFDQYGEIGYRIQELADSKFQS